MSSARRVINKLTEQKKIGLWLGGIKHSISQIGIYVGFLNLLMLSITTYNTGWIQKYIFNVNFIQFISIVCGLILLALVLAFKLDMPSYFGFWKKQVGLDKIEDRLTEIEKKLNILLKKGEDGNKPL
jgi:hypothetical protein